MQHQLPEQEGLLSRISHHDLPLLGVMLLAASLALSLLGVDGWVVPVAASVWIVCSLLPLILARGGQVSALVWLNSLLLVVTIFASLPAQKPEAQSNPQSQPTISSVSGGNSASQAPVVTIKR